MKQLDGKEALIPGAFGGIGRATSKLLYHPNDEGKIIKKKRNLSFPIIKSIE